VETESLETGDLEEARNGALPAHPDASDPGVEDPIRKGEETGSAEPPDNSYNPARVDTGGGVFVRGDVDTGGGTFIGRDQVIINITTSVVDAAEARDLEDLPPEPGESPFQGLQYFSEEDADRFFGRELLTARVVARLAREGFLTIVGASGSGKSSLVRAGVIPALRQGRRLEEGVLPPTDSQKWAYRVFTPTAHPLEALAAALTPDGEPLDTVTELRDRLAREPVSLASAIRRYLQQLQRPRLLLFIDQFEEVFTLCRSQEEREAFITGLLGAAEDGGMATILIALRADHYASLAQHDQLRHAVSQHQEFIGAMSREELVRAIDRPLAQGNWKIQEGLIEVILDDIGYEPGALPLLSHALYETWLRRRGRTLTLSGYTEAGGVRGAVARTAEAVFRGLPDHLQPVARMIFLRMAEVGEDSTDTRRRAAFTELITRATDLLVIQTVVRILADARLVITGAATGGDPEQAEGPQFVEVAHEALIREWPTLRGWLAADRQGLILQQRLTEDAGEWMKTGRDPGLLYRGSRLEQVSAWAAANPEMLCLIDQEFLEASQNAAAEEERRKRQLERSKRVQRALAGFAALLLISIAYLVYTFLIYREPAVMDGFFNIAVAEFGPLGEGVVRQAQEPEDEILDPDQAIYQVLQAELGGNPNLLLWHDGPKLRELNVTIGRVTGDTADEVSRSAAETAARLGADMLIYARRTPDQDSPGVELEFYLAPRADYDYEDLQGGFQPGCSLALDQGSDAPALQETLAPCASTLAWIALGLAEARLGHSLEALEAFLTASRASPDSEAIQFFLGREYLFLVDRESVLEFAREDFERQAEQAFRRSIELAPGYPRAYIGLGSVHAKRARRMISGLPGNAVDPETLAEASRTVDQAVENYTQALELSSPPVGNHSTGIPIDSVARLGLGNGYLLKGRVLAAQGDRAGAVERFDLAIAILEQTLDPLEQAGQARYLTQAFEYLGSVYEWKAYTLVEDQDFSRGLPAYENALMFYDLCLAQGEATEDLIIKNEIVEKICRPSRERLEEYLESIGGTQG